MTSLDELLALLNSELPGAGALTEPQAVPAAAFDERRMVLVEELLSITAPAAFIRQAFRIILKRDPEDSAIRYYGGLLESGEKDRTGILQDLLDSDEGQRKGAIVLGLSSQENLLAALVAEQMRQTAALERMDAELAALTGQMRRLPQAHRALLEIIATLLREHDERRVGGALA
jgi:hypothetical protein